MGSKAILFLCLFALVLVIASEVSARDLAETETKGVEESKYRGGGGGYPGGGYPGGGGGYPGGGGGYPGGGGGYPGGGYPGHGGGGGGGYCRYRCCRHGRCGQCCNSAGEVVNAETETEPQN